MGSVSVSWRSDVWGSKWPKGPPERTYRRVGVGAYRRSSAGVLAWSVVVSPGGRTPRALLTQGLPG
jgi:hypothetical protein